MKSAGGKFKRVTVMARCVVALRATPPRGWKFAGKLQEYDCNTDPGVMYMGLTSAYMRSTEWAKGNSLGSMMRGFSAAPYVGKRIRLTANLKSEGVRVWTGL